ncbi:RidA family protein [Bowmanella dokdonensis]|uniref:RidA family protein n=1 Tax=Bowmanella dokdonensis TaxID=751969 RepID=A0A939DJI1_9ALTE|nr:RidA family protein [Bowmanella dokdonensis]MBN7823879.1 RidA family protein [Bowmanella dokdonensis]
MNIIRINPGKRMSDIAIHNHTAYWAEVPEDLSQDIGGQTRELLALAEGTLNQLGVDKRALISATIFVKRRELVDGMNQEWDAWQLDGQVPVRACVIAELVNPDMLVEILFTAAVP